MQNTRQNDDLVTPVEPALSVRAAHRSAARARALARRRKAIAVCAALVAVALAAVAVVALLPGSSSRSATSPDPRAPAAQAKGGPPPQNASNPFANARFYVDPTSKAAMAYLRLRGSDPFGAALVGLIADRPTAEWFGDWVATSALRARVAGYVANARRAGALPVMVAYDIPKRDCGQYSAGGAPSPQAYRDWITQFAAGIGSGPAVVVVEPDALANLDCLSPADAATRYSLLKFAVSTLDARGATVYLDAGNSSWRPAATMATRLRAAGIAAARGFTLNVANFNRPQDEVAYGNSIDIALKLFSRFVVDTGRSGRGPAPGRDWCNPPGRGLGPAPTATTSNPLVDAYFWIKRPGESDGTCNGGPPAGQWWDSYAGLLAANSGG